MALGPGTYDLTAVMLMIGGIQITGFADGDVITFTHPEALVEPTVGADGQVVMSKLANDHMECEITLLPTSESYPLLYELLVAQHPPGIGTKIVPLAFLCEDTINGEQVSTSDAVFTARPDVSMGKTIGDRVFKMYLPNAGADMVANVNNLTA